ncbi:MAG: 50S ribosomal protein L30 [Deltaproteobacteria bacterium]|nr:50S ribosomal protein L30 [Deltaproteobacteria bacterium]
MVKVTLVSSYHGCTQRQRATLKGLGLMRRGRTVVLRSSAPVRGMIGKVSHLVKVEG